MAWHYILMFLYFYYVVGELELALVTHGLTNISVYKQRNKVVFCMEITKLFIIASVFI